uniref:Uncharacterized protein n=1 Tax=Anguilla anguilla TaxID=7936 RepID=A0A0E9WDF6_ANGAN
MNQRINAFYKREVLAKGEYKNFKTYCPKNHSMKYWEMYITASVYSSVFVRLINFV